MNWNKYLVIDTTKRGPQLYKTNSLLKLWYNTEAGMYLNTVSGTEIVIQYRCRHISQYSIRYWNCDTKQRQACISIQYPVLKLWYKTEAGMYLNTVSGTEIVI